jgi:cytosine/adenosine deaminase-related metal-dependent hydrolase
VPLLLPLPLSSSCLQWLETYTFPVESQFRDLAYARKVYTAAVARGLKSGNRAARATDLNIFCLCVHPT